MQMRRVEKVFFSQFLSAVDFFIYRQKWNVVKFAFLFLLEIRQCVPMYYIPHFFFVL